METILLIRLLEREFEKWRVKTEPPYNIDEQLHEYLLGNLWK